MSSENSGLNESESSEEKEEFNPSSPDGEIDNFEQEGYSEGFYGNFNAESMNTVLLSENLIYAYLKECIDLMVEKETEVVEQGEQAEVDVSKEGISELEQFLNEERERNRLEQEQAGIEPEPELVAKEEDVEQEEEVGNQEKVSEEMVPNEEEVENQERELEEEIQSGLPNESIESGKGEEIEEKNEEPQPHGIEENIEEPKNKLNVDDDKNEEYEQHQSKEQIEEQHDIEFEPIAHEIELELIKEEHEEKEEQEEIAREEEELSQISQELEVFHKINSNETEVLTISQEEELEQEYSSPYREKQSEIEEYKDPQQELEEILEQTREIEQEILIEVEQEQEKSDKNIEENYEKAKSLYNQETGKRPIYSNKETKGFKQWLEQKKKSEEKQEHLQIEQDTEGLIKEIEQESDEEINPKMLKEIIENYNFLESLTTRFKELYGSTQNKQISKAEKNELKLLINSLKKVGPTKFMLFASIKAIKLYTNKEEFSDKANLNHALNLFFTKFLQKNLVFKTLVENQKIKPITHEEKGLSSKAWGALRKLVWTETNKYFKGRINIFKELTIEKYGLLTKHVLNKLNNTLQLSKQKLSKERIGLLKKAIIAIYLLNLDNPPSQAEIRRKSGFGGNYQVKQIREHMQISLPASIRNRALYDNPEIQVRECSICHEIKGYAHYTRRKQSGKLRAECNQCRSERGSIRRFQRKLLAFIYVTLKKSKFLSAENFLEMVEKNGKFSIEVKCSECGLGVYSLPSLELHHNDPNSKDIDFEDLVERKIEVIISALEEDDVDILCCNCHRMYHATDFDEYKNEILEEEIVYFAESVYSVGVMKIIKGYITKRKVIERLSNGKCSSCGKIGLNKLPALSFHHKDPSKKTIQNPSNYIRSHRNVKEMVELMKKEKCAVTCGNCHRNQRSIRFFRNKDEILKKFLDV